ncbi:hypothetical protein BDN67DRAFT_1012005 [Paxillus ammoniavirescens]|nr:hypothetical protein BDN67DRAFT_1012005 [Paxillus ammoniavirescens]
MSGMTPLTSSSTACNMSNLYHNPHAELHLSTQGSYTSLSDYQRKVGLGEFTALARAPKHSDHFGSHTYMDATHNDEFLKRSLSGSVSGSEHDGYLLENMSISRRSTSESSSSASYAPSRHNLINMPLIQDTSGNLGLELAISKQEAARLKETVHFLKKKVALLEGKLETYEYVYHR